MEKGGGYEPFRACFSSGVMSCGEADSRASMALISLRRLSAKVSVLGRAGGRGLFCLLIYREVLIFVCECRLTY